MAQDRKGKGGYSGARGATRGGGSSGRSGDRGAYSGPRGAGRGEERSFGKPRSPGRGAGFGKPAPRYRGESRDGSRDAGRNEGREETAGGWRGDAREEARAPRRGTASTAQGAYGDPYRHVERPARAERSDRSERRGFTVTLDPDVARVFRGDASVNKALRLVLQLMQVVQGPPRSSFGERPQRGAYQGSDEARGFKRKPRFAEDDDATDAGIGEAEVEE